MRRRLVGAMCPTCRTVQDWSGENILRARISCCGDAQTGQHERATVVVVSAVVQR